MTKFEPKFIKVDKTKFVFHADANGTRSVLVDDLVTYLNLSQTTISTRYREATGAAQLSLTLDAIPGRGRINAGKRARFACIDELGLVKLLGHWQDAPRVIRRAEVVHRLEHLLATWYAEMPAVTPREAGISDAAFPIPAPLAQSSDFAGFKAYFEEAVLGLMAQLDKVSIQLNEAEKALAEQALKNKKELLKEVRTLLGTGARHRATTAQALVEGKNSRCGQLPLGMADMSVAGEAAEQ